MAAEEMTAQRPAGDETLSYPRLAARTQRFTLGRPRSFSVGNDGARVVFLRSRDGQDPVTCLWVLDVADAQERLVADPRAFDAAGGDLPPAERARRERAREQAGGITSYAVDTDATVATFSLGGHLGIADLRTGQTRLLPELGVVADPRPAPDGSDLVAFVRDGSTVVTTRNGLVRKEISGPPGTTAGLVDFIAAEELGRMRGLWWAPDGSALLVAVVDEGPVNTWYISDAAHPEIAPSPQRYPAAGTANAVVSLLVVPMDGEPVPVTGWDGGAFPYLVQAGWNTAGLALTVLSRDQRSEQVLLVDPATGAARLRATRSADSWIDVVPGLPHLLEDGRLLHAAEDGARRGLALDGQVISPVALHVAGVRHVGDGAAMVVGTEDDPTVRHVYAVALPAADAAAGAAVFARQLSGPPGVHDAVAGGSVVVSITATLAAPAPAVSVRRGGTAVADIASYAHTPLQAPRVRIVRGGPRDLVVGIVLPAGHVRGTRLPVLMDPYGGPHHSEVLAAQAMWREPQWLADQGFAVVVADGRGTPGRDLAWERSVQGDLASPALEDQVAAIALAADHEPDLDLSRVAIRGWSFGGYLAALAVLRRPDVFHAAIAGAPVTDWSLYDTAYTERYLGTDPRGADAAAYARSSLLADAPRLRRPLLLIHGLADDNVVAAHTLRLSAALLAHGRPHDVLPITGATHMTSAEDVAENMLTLQVDWLRRALRPA